MKRLQDDVEADRAFPGRGESKSAPTFTEAGGAIGRWSFPNWDDTTRVRTFDYLERVRAEIDPVFQALEQALGTKA